MGKGRKAKDLIGSKYGKLTVIKKAGTEKGHTMWLCKCDCGRQNTVRGSYLLSGQAGSCGECGRYRPDTDTTARSACSLSLTRLKAGDDPYENLANAIVAVAVDDYRTALAENDAGSQRVLEKFFHSCWYATLTSLSADLLIELLHKEHKESLQKA